MEPKRSVDGVDGEMSRRAIGTETMDEGMKEPLWEDRLDCWGSSGIGRAAAEFLEHLTGDVFLSHYQAVAALAPEIIQAAPVNAPARRAARA
jgi:hypothetical protein